MSRNSSPPYVVLFLAIHSVMEFATLDVLYALSKSAVQSDVIIARTLCFRDGRCAAAFEFDEHSRTVVCNPEWPSSDSSEESRRFAIYDSFAFNAAIHDVVACLILPVPAGTARVPIDYLTVGRLRQFLGGPIEYDCLLCELPSPPGRLSTFRHSLTHCIFEQGALLAAEGFINKHSLYSGQADSSYSTMTHAASPHVEPLILKAASVGRLQRLTSTIELAFRSLGGATGRLSLYFALLPGNAGVLGRWIFLCASEAPALSQEVRWGLDRQLSPRQGGASGCHDADPDVESLDWGDSAAVGADDPVEVAPVVLTEFKDAFPIPVKGKYTAEVKQSSKTAMHSQGHTNRPRKDEVGSPQAPLKPWDFSTVVDWDCTRPKQRKALSSSGAEIVALAVRRKSSTHALWDPPEVADASLAGYVGTPPFLSGPLLVHQDPDGKRANPSVHPFSGSRECRSNKILKSLRRDEDASRRILPLGVQTVHKVQKASLFEKALAASISKGASPAPELSDHESIHSLSPPGSPTSRKRAPGKRSEFAKVVAQGDTDARSPAVDEIADPKSDFFHPLELVDVFFDACYSIYDEDMLQVGDSKYTAVNDTCERQLTVLANVAVQRELLPWLQNVGVRTIKTNPNEVLLGVPRKPAVVSSIKAQLRHQADKMQRWIDTATTDDIVQARSEALREGQRRQLEGPLFYAVIKRRAGI